jgi:tRNA (adenine37-N6)-methyltransferase
MFTPKAIGFVRSPYTRTTEVPRGLGAKHEAVGTVEILGEFEPGLRDIEGFSHLFVIWVFDRSGTVELTGQSPADHKVHGVFATRSPFRPNPLALTVVELLGREGCTLHVKGVDMLDGTPVLDIKPYLSGVAEEKLRRGWLEAAEKAGRGGNPSGVETRS